MSPIRNKSQAEKSNDTELGAGGTETVKLAVNYDVNFEALNALTPEQFSSGQIRIRHFTKNEVSKYFKSYFKTLT